MKSNLNCLAASVRVLFADLGPAPAEILSPLSNGNFNDTLILNFLFPDIAYNPAIYPSITFTRTVCPRSLCAVFEASSLSRPARTIQSACTSAT